MEAIFKEVKLLKLPKDSGSDVNWLSDKIKNFKLRKLPISLGILVNWLLSNARVSKFPKKSFSGEIGPVSPLALNIIFVVVHYN